MPAERERHKPNFSTQPMYNSSVVWPHVLASSASSLPARLNSKSRSQAPWSPARQRSRHSSVSIPSPAPSPQVAHIADMGGAWIAQ